MLTGFIPLMSSSPVVSSSSVASSSPVVSSGRVVRVGPDAFTDARGIRGGAVVRPPAAPGEAAREGGHGRVGPGRRTGRRVHQAPRSVRRDRPGSHPEPMSSHEKARSPQGNDSASARRSNIRGHASPARSHLLKTTQGRIEFGSLVPGRDGSAQQDVRDRLLRDPARVPLAGSEVQICICDDLMKTIIVHVPAQPRRPARFSVIRPIVRCRFSTVRAWRAPP